MTEAELLALPEWPNALGAELRDGVRVEIASPLSSMSDAIYMADSLDQTWMVGTINGIRYRAITR